MRGSLPMHPAQLVFGEGKIRQLPAGERPAGPVAAAKKFRKKDELLPVLLYGKALRASRYLKGHAPDPNRIQPPKGKMGSGLPVLQVIPARPSFAARRMAEPLLLGAKLRFTGRAIELQGIEPHFPALSRHADQLGNRLPLVFSPTDHSQFIPLRMGIQKLHQIHAAASFPVFFCRSAFSVFFCHSIAGQPGTQRKNQQKIRRGRRSAGLLPNRVPFQPKLQPRMNRRLPYNIP